MNRNDASNDNDKPPFSRLFIVCSKNHTVQDLLPSFEKHGQVEDLYMPKDRNTGMSKGIAFVKYSKTSSAAAAIQDLHMKSISKDSKPIKVMVSSDKSGPPHTNEEKFKRLFIKVHKSVSESDIFDHFAEFGTVTSVHLQKDKGSDQCKGFAYVNFNSFYDAAKAFEECDSKYRPIFATPKEELKRPRVNDEFDNYYSNQNNGSSSWKDDSFDQRNHSKYDFDNKDNIVGLIKTRPQNFDSINVTCSPGVPQKYIEQLFSIIPGMVNFRYSSEFNESKALIKYDSEVAAAHAVESLNFYEFPSGEMITVNAYHSPLTQAANNLSEIVSNFRNVKESSSDMLQLAQAIAEASNLIKSVAKEKMPDNYNDYEYICGVKLPMAKPMASKGSKVAQRCFLVLKPMPPPQHVLHNLFCRFGDLIEVSMFPNKTFGFAKYASSRAAQEAMTTLHGSTIYGIKFKVIEADERPPKEGKTSIGNDEEDLDNVVTKRIKFGQE